MSTQDEYLRNFTVLLTEKGVVPLTDPIQIAVYNELCEGSKRPSDISESLGIPSSSLHFVLDKMTDYGAIVRFKPDVGKKSVYYSNLALKIVGSKEPYEGATDKCRRTFDDPFRYYSGLSSVANMLDNYVDEIGLSLDQLRRRYVEDLADSMRQDISEGRLEDTVPKIKEMFARVTGFRFSVFALTPFTLVFEGNRVMSTKIDMLTVLVNRAISNATGKHYSVSSVEDFGSEDTARFKVVFERTEKKPEPYINMSLPQSGEVFRFLIVELDGTVGIITSPVQIDIIDTVYERPLCITDIVNKVEAPRSTVTSNILRMVEEGVIAVFYSESGTAYYGMSCSILMKKSRGLNRDSSEIHSILASVGRKERALMEGYLLYLLSTLNGLGFDTDYMMVVLGAKYMRINGTEEPRNFNVFFRKMSDIAKNIGLSLNVVSVYPLTIGITSDKPASEISSAMTFVKGMAHQGLEMASSGIFVRVSEDAPADRKVSFKEIYPALSITPMEGISVEGLPDANAAKSKKKRTSSVRTALLNRSVKESGKPVRTVRYITGIMMMAFVATVLVFGFSGLDDNGADAEKISVNLAKGCDGVYFYDENDEEILMPLQLDLLQTLEFTIVISDESDISNIGVVENGVAYPIESYLTTTDDGMYTMTANQDITFQPITLLKEPDAKGLSYYIYCFSSSVSDSYAYTYSGYITLNDYVEQTGGFWVTSGAIVLVVADDGSCIRTNNGSSDLFLFDRIVCSVEDALSFTTADLPRDCVQMHLEGNFEADGWFVSGTLKMVGDSDVSLRFISTNGPVIITMITLGGIREDLVLEPMDRTVTFHIGFEDVVISYAHVGIY